MVTQRDLIASHLARFDSITPLEALTRYGVMRLAARIAELREDGMSIVTDTRVENGRRYGSYRLAQ